MLLDRHSVNLLPNEERIRNIPTNENAHVKFMRFLKTNVTFDKNSGCWIVGTDRKYARIHFDYHEYLAHRFSYSLIRKEKIDDLEIDHLCMNKRCINPGHLEPVTRLVNAQRVPKHLYWKHRSYNPKTHRNSIKTHCKRGHIFDEANTLYNGSKKARNCKICRKLMKEKRNELKRS